MAENKLSYSDTKYLLAIGRVKTRNGYARVTDVAEELHVSKPCVSRSAVRLMQLSLLEKDRFGFLCLTNQGIAVVRWISEKETAIRQLFSLVTDKTYTCPENELEKIAYVVSDNTVRAVLEGVL